MATVAMAGVVVYAIVDVVLQFLPPHYSAIRDAESDLAVGPFGWIMAINFFGRGITSAAAIVAIRLTGPPSRTRALGTVLFAVAGACSALIAFFPTDIPVVSGAGAVATTWHGAVHLAGASTGFVFALAAFWVLAFWLRRVGLPAGVRVAAAIFLATASIGLAFLAATIIVAPGLLGLAERICLAGILGWVFVLGVGLRRISPRSSEP